MKILAIDSSGLVAGVAVSENGICVAEYNVQYKVTHSQTLLPMTDEVLKRVSSDIKDVDAYAVAAGPGSFTGLRIGIATVKGLAMVHDKPIAAVPTLEALAYNLYGAKDLICPIMDARREQVYTGIYEFDYNSQFACGSSAGALKCLMPQSAMGFDELCGRLNDEGRRVIFTGDGTVPFEPAMKELLKVEYDIAPLHMNRQRGAALAALADFYLNCEKDAVSSLGLQGTVTDVIGLTPVYLRESQAERERKAANAD